MAQAADIDTRTGEVHDRPRLVDETEARPFAEVYESARAMFLSAKDALKENEAAIKDLKEDQKELKATFDAAISYLASLRPGRR